MSGPEYTSCIAPGVDPHPPKNLIVALTADLWDVADYMLHRKLTCNGHLEPGKPSPGDPHLEASPKPGESCAVGRVISFEPPSSKTFPDTIDNDDCFNILLRPDDHAPIWSDDPFNDQAWFNADSATRLQRVRTGYQGQWLTEQPGMPKPREANDGDPRYAGYSAALVRDPDTGRSGVPLLVPGSGQVPGTGLPTLDWLVQFPDGTQKRFALTTPGLYDVPVLHCECEGTRVRDVFDVVDQMPGGGSGCKKHWYTRVLCTIARWLSLPFTAAFVAEAWNNARDGNISDSLEGGGTLNIGDLVLVRGRWTFDSGHHGYNEIHAVHSIQKVPGPTPPPGSDPKDFEAFYLSWCASAAEVPPDPQPGNQQTTMTPAQAAVLDNQKRPENQFVMHPAIDGCAPASGSGSGTPTIR